jgi:hypothetical protein
MNIAMSREDLMLIFDALCWTGDNPQHPGVHVYPHLNEEQKDLYDKLARAVNAAHLNDLVNEGWVVRGGTI